MNWSRGENRSGSTLGGIAFSRVGNCTELDENLDRVSGEKGDFSLFFGFLRGDYGKMMRGWEQEKGLMFPVPQQNSLLA